MFKYLFQFLAILSIALIAIFTVIFTYQQVLGFLISLGMVAAAAPISPWLFGACFGVAFLFGLAFLPQSMPTIWNKFSAWGHRLDITIWSWCTGEEYYIDAANALIKESNKLIHAVENMLDNLLKRDQEWSKPVLDLKTSGKQEFFKYEHAIVDKLSKADEKLDAAGKKLRGQDPADPESSEIDRKAGDAVREQKLTVIRLREIFDKLKKKYLANETQNKTQIEGQVSYFNPIDLFPRQRYCCLQCAKPRTFSSPDLSSLIRHNL